MKKKIVATLLVTALAAGSAAGLTACGGVSLPKGDEVTQKEWETAFEKTLSLTNYTLNASIDAEVELNGTVTRKIYSPDASVKTEQVALSMSGSTASRLTVLYDEKVDKAYTETNAESNQKGAYDGEDAKSERKQVSKSYYELSEKKEENKKFWRARYSLEENSVNSSEGKEESYEEEFWYASETSSFASNYVASMAEGMTSFYTSDGDDAEEKSIYELYESFTYAGGTYTATLYQEVKLYSGVYEMLPCTVTVSFNKSECCVIGLGVKIEGDGTAFEKDQYDLKYSYKGESVYALSDINATDATKSDKDIVKAIDKAKQEKEEN